MRKFRKGFPKISLPDAIARAEQVYKKEYNHPAPRNVIAMAMGYSGISGASSVMLSALSIYGLIEHVGGDEYKISDDALNFFLHERGDRERVDSVKAVALRPPIFGELNAKFGGLASDKNIEAYLVKNDYHPETTRTIIQAYRETMQFAEYEVGGSISQADTETPETVPERPAVDQSTSRSIEPQVATTNALAVGTTDEALVFKISRNSSARILFSGGATQESIDKLIKLLELSRDAFPSEQEVALSENDTHTPIEDETEV